MQRRRVSDGDFTRLIEGTRRSDRRFRGLSGEDRAMAYVTAAYTGLRAKELSRLFDFSLDLDSGLPTAAVNAADTKNRKKANQPLNPHLAEMLSAWMDRRGREPAERPHALPIQDNVRQDPQPAQDATAAKLWPGRWYRDAAEMLRRDLAVVGIPYEDSRGLVFDFHALRHQFITSLEKAGVHGKRLQKLARHSKPELTVRYTHVDDNDMADGVNLLPPPPGAVSDGPTEATGTEGSEICCTICASQSVQERPILSLRGESEKQGSEGQEVQKPWKNNVLPGNSKARPTGIEPATTGSTGHGSS